MSLTNTLDSIAPEDVVAIWYSLGSVWISTKTNPRPFIINCGHPNTFEQRAKAVQACVTAFKIRWPGKPVVRMKHYTERKRRND